MGDDEKHHPLVTSSPVVHLYDPVCMLDCSRDVASGYLILLQGGPSAPSPSPQKRRGKRDRTAPDIDEGAVTLAFLALTDGNVINACFGAPSQLLNASSSPSHTMAQRAKRALADAADTSDAVRRLSVETYAKAFRIVLEEKDQEERLSPCSRCFKHAQLRREAEADLQVAFWTLSEAVSAIR